jgi:hypothetical protein
MDEKFYFLAYKLSGGAPEWLPVFGCGLPAALRAFNRDHPDCIVTAILPSEMYVSLQNFQL